MGLEWERNDRWLELGMVMGVVEGWRAHVNLWKIARLILMNDKLLQFF